MSEVDEACNQVTALLRLDPKAAIKDLAAVHSIQLAVRRLLISDSNQAEIALRQLTMLSRVLRHFGPSPLRSMRLLIAELVFRCICSPSFRTRKLSASLHQWLLVLFGPECVQQRSEFLAIGLARLACQHLGIDYKPAADNSGNEQQQNSECSIESLYLASKAAATDSEARLAEQLIMVSPIDLFVCYCDALIHLLSPVATPDSNASVELYLPSILAIFDTLSDAFLKFRTSSAVDSSRIRCVMLPLFKLFLTITRSSFRRQLLPAARRICKPIVLASSVVEKSGELAVFFAWAHAYRWSIEAFGFRASPLDEHLSKSSLDLVLKTLRNELNGPESQYTCSVISASCDVFSAVLSCSLPAQRNSMIDGVISSVLQLVVSSFASSDRHLCSKCCQSVCSLLSAGVVAPPFASSGGVSSPYPTVAGVLSTLSCNSRRSDVEVASVFSATLSACLQATARPLAPPITQSYSAISPVAQPQEPPSRDRLPLFQLPLLPPPPPVEESPSRRRLRSNSQASSINNNLSASSSSTSNNNKLAPPAKRLKTNSRCDHDGSDDDDVVIVPDPEAVETRNGNAKKKNDVHAKPAAATTTETVEIEETAMIDGLFMSTFVPAPPDNEVVHLN